MFLFVYKLLTVADVAWNDVAPGALVAGVAWTVLQSIGNYFVGTRLENANALYGLFGIVIGLLSWLYLGGQITLYRGRGQRGEEDPRLAAIDGRPKS